MQINLAQLLFQIANFAVILFVLTKFLYRPLLKIMESRSKKIQAGLEAAEKSLEEQAKAEEKRRQVLAQAEKEAAKILDQAKEDAKKIGKDIVEAAKKDAQESIEREYQILKAKLEEEENKVRRNIATVVAKTTKAVLQNALSEAAHKQIIKKQISNLKRFKN